MRARCHLAAQPADLGARPRARRASAVTAFPGNLRHLTTRDSVTHHACQQRHVAITTPHTVAAYPQRLCELAVLASCRAGVRPRLRANGHWMAVAKGPHNRGWHAGCRCSRLLNTTERSEGTPTDYSSRTQARWPLITTVQARTMQSNQVLITAVTVQHMTPGSGSSPVPEPPKRMSAPRRRTQNHCTSSTGVPCEHASVLANK